MHVCVSTADNVRSRHHPVLGKGTDFSSLKKFLGKFPLVSRNFWASKFPRLGEFEPNFPEEILGEEIFPENFVVRNVFFPQDFFDPSNPKISWKNFLVRPLLMLLENVIRKRLF